MNLYKKNMLKHVMPMNPRRHHKYLYIDANGNYVYPEDVAKKAGNKARDLNAQGQANAVNMRKERAERINAGNNRMAAKLKGVYAQGQANNVNARKARAESINAGNERIANSKAYKIGKTILGESKAGKAIKKIGKSGTVVGKELSKVTIPEGQRAKQKSKEEIAREDAELERRVSEGIEEFGRQQAEKYYKEQAKKKAEQFPEGWVRDQNGYVYDDIRAMAIDPNDPRLKKKKKRAKKNVAKVVKTSVAHSDTYRSNVMNSHQRKIYASQLQHAERRNHKYLYKIGDRYVYPEDVVGKAKNKLSEAGNKVSSGIKKEKAKLKSIDRGSGYVGTNNKINDLPGSVYSNKKDDAKIRRDYANKKQEEYRKWERHEYFDKTDPKRQEEKTKIAKQIAVSSDAKARQAENRLATATKDAENYQKANKIERTAAKAYGRYESKKIAKEVENNNKKPHEVNVRKKKSPNKISEAYNNAKKGFRDFGNSAKASYEAGKKAGAAVAEAEKRKKKKKPTVKGSKKVTTWDNAKIKKW